MRTPVIVGVGQTQTKPASADEIVEALDLMVDAVRLAVDDSGSGDRLLKQTQSVRVVESLSWRTADPGALVAERLGISPTESILTATGGNSPQMLVNATAAAIQAGELEVALIVGAEAMYSRRQARKLEQRAATTTQPEGTPSAQLMGENKMGSHAAELARSLAMPTQVYPVFENAVRAARGESVEEHQRTISELWSRFSEVAAKNPNAWSPQARSAEEIRTTSADNRMISFPYPKLMNANMQVDQGAALLLCSAEAARAAGVSEEKWVYPISGADATDHWFISERENLYSSPAIRAAGLAALGLAGLTVDEVAHIDLYSCFPVAVQIAAAELGLPLDRQLTLTGGLTFAGGPGNNYVTHSIATVVERLRAEPDTLGMVTALGWYVTKHAVGIYGTNPPSAGFRKSRPQEQVDSSPRREVVEEHDGAVKVESYTVHHDREGAPETGVVACLLEDGRRAWGTTTDADLMRALTTEDLVGRPATLRADGTVDVS